MYSHDFDFDKSKFCRNPKKSGSGRCAMGDILTGDTCCYTLEVSFFCSSFKGVKDPPYTQSSFMELGKNIGRALGDIYKVPRECRHNLLLYNLPHNRDMKGYVVDQIIDDHENEGDNKGNNNTKENDDDDNNEVNKDNIE